MRVRKSVKSWHVEVEWTFRMPLWLRYAAQGDFVVGRRPMWLWDRWPVARLQRGLCRLEGHTPLSDGRCGWCDVVVLPPVESNDLTCTHAEPEPSPYDWRDDEEE